MGNSAEAERYFAIDWTKEPESDRDRKIRSVLLRRKLSDSPFGAALYLSEQIGFRTTEVSKMASDFRAALGRGSNRLRRMAR